MTMPRSGQTVHMMSTFDVCRVLWEMRRKEGRNTLELSRLYTADDLRRLYQETVDDPIRLRDGIISRVQLVAVVRWRLWWQRFSYRLLLVVSMIAALAALVAVYEGRATLP